MKLLALLLILPFGLAAQLNDWRYTSLFTVQNSIQFKWYNWDPNLTYGGKNVSMAGIDTLKRYRAGRSGRRKLIHTQTYNADGLLTGDLSKKATHTYQYRDTLLIAVNTVLPNGKTFGSTYTYDDKGQLTEAQYFSKGKAEERYRYAYSGNSCVFREYTDLSRRKQHVYRITSELNEAGRIARSTYTIDGKTEKVWDYSCNEKGTVADDKTLAQSSSCTFEQHNNDGSYSVFVRSIKEGKTYLTESSYSADSVLTSWKEFLNDSVLVRQNTFTKTRQRFDSYADNGRYRSGFVAVLDENGRRIETHTYNKRRRERIGTAIVYNENGLISTISLHNRGKKYGEEILEYSTGAL